MSLVAHKFGLVELRILFVVFYRQAQLEKIKTNVQNSTHPNWWAIKDIRAKKYCMHKQNHYHATFQYCPRIRSSFKIRKVEDTYHLSSSQLNSSLWHKMVTIMNVELSLCNWVCVKQGVGVPKTKEIQIIRRLFLVITMYICTVKPVQWITKPTT